MKDFNVPVDIDLLKKYDQPGPRYTSYPTAPHFHTGITHDQYMRRISKDDKEIEKRDLSLYFHIPFCDTLCYFCGCSMMVTSNSNRIIEYLAYLEKEIGMLKSFLGKDRKVKQLHWGGGTPTHLQPNQIRRLGNAIRNRFEYLEDAEIGVEIDPRELTYDHMKALVEVGFNRCSMGVQDFDPKVQLAVNRVQPEDITRQAVEWARSLGFNSLNLDLMYGLPHQNLGSFSKTLDTLISMNPDRVAVFNYAHLPDMIKHQRLIKPEWLPSAEEKLKLLKVGIEKLTAAGYVYIGMDHFARPDDELTVAMQEGTLYRNFQGYSTNAGIDMFALGITGIGMLSDMYMQNYKTFKDYYNALDGKKLPFMRGVILTKDDQIRREVITTLLCNFSLDTNRISEKYSIDFENYFKDSLEDLMVLTKDHLVEYENKIIQVTQRGRLLIRNIVMCFDAYLRNKNLQKHRYSRTV